MKRFGRTAFAAALLILIILAGCQPANPGPGDVPFDWCFTFDFTTSNTGIGTPYGTWEVGHGFTEDAAGRLSVGYTQDAVVTPGLVIVTVRRPTGSTGPINVQALGNIFGIPIDQDQTLPNGINSSVINIKPSGANQQSNTFNVSVLTTHPLYFESIEVEGSGISPFPQNPCSASTGTPTAPFFSSDTPTPTATSTPGPTLTPSNTLTPSATPTQSACINDLNLRTTQVASILPGNNGFWESGFGYRSGAPYSDGFTTGVRLFAEIDLWSIISASVDLNNASGATLTVSSTNTAAWSIVGYDDSKTHSMNLLSATGSISSESLQTNQGFSDPTNIKVRWLELSAAHVQGTTNPYIGFATVYLAGTCYPISPTATPTFTPSLTGTLTPSLTFTPSQTTTAFPATNSPAPTNTRIPILTLPPLGTLPPPNTPFGTPWGTPSTPGGTPNTGTPAITGPTPGIGGTGTPGAGGGGGEGLNGLTDGIGTIGGAVLGGASNAMRQGFKWLGEVAGVFRNITTAWSNATPQEIPGLPDCVNEPAISQVCAIFYMLQYTVFSGTIGGVLIPAATIVMNLWTILNFLALGRAILERLRKITSV